MHVSSRVYFSLYTYKKAVSTVPLVFYDRFLARISFTYYTILYLHLPLSSSVAIFTIARFAPSTPICAIVKNICCIYLFSTFVSFSLFLSLSISRSHLFYISRRDTLQGVKTLSKRIHS